MPAPRHDDPATSWRETLHLWLAELEPLLAFAYWPICHHHG